MDSLITCIIFIFSFNYVYSAINIVELKGPSYVEYGSANEITLDCNFEAGGEKDLEIKWFYNGDTNIIYQWIPDLNKGGSAMGMLKGRVDLNYSISNDPNTKYRALRIFNVTTDLTGNYTCKVSSFDSEDAETKQLIIYNPAKNGLNLSVLKENNTIICNAEGLFPEPEMNIYYVTGPNNTRYSIEDREDIILDNTIDCEKDEYGYNVTKTYVLANLTDVTEQVEFICDLVLPGTNYSLTESVIYHSKNSALACSSKGCLLATITAILMLLCKSMHI